ncbi:MAG TPA: hypothetical protein VIM98_15735 [Dyella sp.]|uniref:hypothetical protein n=1 Tax=Dyella sp. TaxID=1869338 RepID=UPI002F930F55
MRPITPITVSMDLIQADLAAARPIFLRDLCELIGTLDRGREVNKTPDTAMCDGGYRTTTYRFVECAPGLAVVEAEVIDATRAVIRLALYLKPSASLQPPELIERYELHKRVHHDGSDQFEQYARSYLGGNLHLHVPIRESGEPAPTEVHIFADPRISSPSAYQAPV